MGTSREHNDENVDLLDLSRSGMNDIASAPGYKIIHFAAALQGVVIEGFFAHA